MTFEQLLTFVAEQTNKDFLSSGVTLEQIIKGHHPHQLIGDMIRRIADYCSCQTLDCELKREDVVKALGPLRLEYMKDDAPVEGFRLLEGAIVAIDLAFNNEALQNKR